MVAHWGTRPLFIPARTEQVCREVCSVYQINVFLGSLRQIPASDAGGAPDLPAVGSFSVGVVSFSLWQKKPWLPGNSFVTLTGLTGVTPCPRATRNYELQGREVHDPDAPNAPSTPSTRIPIPALLVVVNNYKTSYLIFSGSWGNHFNNGIFVALLCNVHLLLVCRMFIVHSLTIEGEPLLNDF